MRLSKRLPDILIGILIVVLAVGLGSLLLTQRNRAAAPVAVVPQAAIPAAPGNDTPVAAKPVTTPNQPAVTTPPVRHDVPVTPPVTTQPNATPPDTTQPVAPVTPATPNTVPVTTPTPQPPATPEVDTSQPPVVTTPAAPATGPDTDITQPAAPVQAARAHPVATSAERIPLRRDYRVSLGIFDDVQQAMSRTAAVRALGYRVYPIKVGERYVVQVGPFANATDAQQAQQDIARSYAGAVMLAPRGVRPPVQATTPASDSPAASNTPAAPVRTQPASPETNTTALNWQTPGAPAATQPTQTTNNQTTDTPTTASPAPASAPAPAGPVYLQVGAFDRQESAQKLVDQLQGLGYDPTVQAPEGKKVTVLIGPFHGAALLRTETRLNANGLDHFRVR